MLTQYRNDLFATSATMTQALLQANDIYGKALSTADSIAMRTAVYIVLNTAIQQHTFEMDALRDKHAAEVQALRSQLAARPDPVTALLSLVDERVNAALDERMDNVFADKFDAAVDSWADDKLDDMVHEKVTDFFGNNTFSIEPR